MKERLFSKIFNIRRNIIIKLVCEFNSTLINNKKGGFVFPTPNNEVKQLEEDKKKGGEFSPPSKSAKTAIVRNNLKTYGLFSLQQDHFPACGMFFCFQSVVKQSGRT
jgi:hypothetical protein